jgi:hypothetical protein
MRRFCFGSHSRTKAKVSASASSRPTTTLIPPQSCRRRSISASTPDAVKFRVHRVRREEDVPASHRNRFLTPTEVAAFIEGKAN